MVNILTDRQRHRQTDTYTDKRITIFRNCSCGRSNNDNLTYNVHSVKEISTQRSGQLSDGQTDRQTETQTARQRQSDRQQVAQYYGGDAQW